MVICMGELVGGNVTILPYMGCVPIYSYLLKNIEMDGSELPVLHLPERGMVGKVKMYRCDRYIVL